MDKRLELTEMQQQAWNSLIYALKACDSVGVGFITNGDGTYYAVNEQEVKDYIFPEDCTNDDIYVDLEQLPGVSVISFMPGHTGFGVRFKKQKK